VGTLKTRTPRLRAAEVGRKLLSYTMVQTIEAKDAEEIILRLLRDNQLVCWQAEKKRRH
jgi:hypothetical protein